MTGHLADRVRAGGLPAADVHALPMRTADGEETARLRPR
jgi:hypothetical protein